MISKLPRWVEAGGFCIACIAGATNAVGVLSFEHYAVSHLTGTFTLLGISLAELSVAESVRSAAMAYQSDRQAKQQIEMLKLDMLAAATGAIAIWQAGPFPAAGVYGRPISVMVPAQNSEIATQMALQRYPGSVLVGVRRGSR